MSEFNPDVARSEGWDLFDVDGVFRLQKIDDPGNWDIDLGYTEPKFTDDVEAIIYVAQKAKDGSDYHWRALGLMGSKVRQ